MEMIKRKKQDCVSDIDLRRRFFCGKSIVFVRNDFFLKNLLFWKFIYLLDIPYRRKEKMQIIFMNLFSLSKTSVLVLRTNFLKKKK